MVEQADATDSKSVPGNRVGVRFPPPAFNKNKGLDDIRQPLVFIPILGKIWRKSYPRKPQQSSVSHCSGDIAVTRPLHDLQGTHAAVCPYKGSAMPEIVEHSL